MLKLTLNGKIMKIFVKPMMTFLRRIKLQDRFLFFGRNSGIHGLTHLFAIGAFIISRLFWLLILMTSAWCLYLLLLSEGGDSLNFTPDTLYLPWTTTFPAVTVCEIYGPRVAQKKFNEKYPNYTKSLSLDFKKYISAVLYGRGTCSKSLCVPCGNQVSCDIPFREIADNVRLKCTELISNCSFGGEEFPCCDKFHIVDSEYGPCYSINTLQSEKSKLAPLFAVNTTTGPGKLDFRVLADTEVSVHSPEDLATLDLDPKFKVEIRLYNQNRVIYYFSVVEIENDVVLTREDLSVRQCRYLHERPQDPFYKYPVYGYGACKLAHDTEHLFEHCNCVHPIRHKVYEKQFCNYTGIHCINIHQFEKMKQGVDQNPKGSDSCLPSCDESELTTVHVSKYWRTEDTAKGTAVTVQMSSLPTLRFQRNFIRSNLDTVVNVGGMISLFFGASILSLVEIFYLILRKQ